MGNRTERCQKGHAGELQRVKDCREREFPGEKKGRTGGGWEYEFVKGLERGKLSKGLSKIPKQKEAIKRVKPIHQW